MKQLNYMFELSHPSRLGILRLASTRKIRHTELIQASGLSPSEVTRHTHRLQSSGLLKKTRSGEFRTTSNGQIVLNWLENFEFMSFNAPYLENHRLNELPIGFDLFHVLRQCEKITGTMNGVNTILRINAESRTLLNGFIEEFHDSVVNIHYEKIKYGIDMKLITVRGKRIPFEYSEVDAVNLFMKSLPSVPFFFVASEKECVVCFREVGGEIDYSTCFITGNENIIEWFNMLFYYYWERGSAIEF